ncbi:MAG: phage Gp19/Gp15/Gp42 family protein [Erysipelotrichaceae bacterium]|nr:phage Gp19/Gp15/Gp42 family protein [Erysipelotrichaceae bacterium]
MSDFATVNDVITLWRELSPEEAERAEALLPLISDALRYEATKVGKDLDAMVADSNSYANVVKLVTVDVCSRILRQNTSGEMMSQESQAALGYSWSGTYAIPGGGMANAIMNNDLKRLGLKRQRIGALEIYQYDSWNNG